MKKLMEIVVCVLALIGLACVVKHIHIANCKEGCCLCGSFKTNMQEFKTKVKGFKSKVQGYKTEVEEENRTGSRYGSNPIKY